MKGMTIQQFTQIMEFAQKNHPFGGVHDGKIPLTGQHHIKYIDSTYDSRTQTIWNVSFRGLGTNLRFRNNHFMSLDKVPDDFKFTTLHDWIMAYLKGEWKPSENMLRRMEI